MTRIRTRAAAALAALRAALAPRPSRALAETGALVARLEWAADRLEASAAHLAAALIVADVLAEMGGAL